MQALLGVSLWRLCCEGIDLPTVLWHRLALTVGEGVLHLIIVCMVITIAQAEQPPQTSRALEISWQLRLLA